MNALFEYCYRDGGNWKRYGAVVFGGAPADELEERLRRALHQGEWFIAAQVRVPEVFFERVDPEDDHCWHEYVGLSTTGEEATDPFERPIEALVEELCRAAAEGWREFDVATQTVGFMTEMSS